MKKPNLNNIIADNLDKAKFQSKVQPSLPGDGWLNQYQSGGTYISDRGKATQFGQYKNGGGMRLDIPVIDDAGNFNQDGIWVPDWKTMTAQAKKLRSKKVKTRSGNLINFNNNWEVIDVDDNPSMKMGGGMFPPYHSFTAPRMQNGGGLLSRTVTCSNCGWSWKAVDGGKDVMTCHKCGGMIKMKEGGSYDTGGLTTIDTTKPEGGWGCKGKSCTMTGEGIKKEGVRDQPSDEGSGDYVNYAGFNSPINWLELINYNNPNTADLSKKQANKVINNYKENVASRAVALQNQFPGVTQNQVLAAMGDSSRIAQRRSDTARYNQPSEQTFDKAYHRFYQPLINQPARVTVPQILQFHSQQPFGLQGYEQTVQGNYGRKKAKMGGEWLNQYAENGLEVTTDTTIAPLYTQDPRKIKAYNDSLKLYNQYKTQGIKSERYQLKKTPDRIIPYKNLPYIVNPNSFDDRDINIKSSFDNHTNRDAFFADTKIKPVAFEQYSRIPDTKEKVFNAVYKKPVQPYILGKKPVQQTTVQQPIKQSVPVQQVAPIQTQVTPGPTSIDYTQLGESIFAPNPYGGGAFVGYIDKNGQAVYVKPEDYQRMGVPSYGKEYIEQHNKKQKYGGATGWLDQYQVKGQVTAPNFMPNYTMLKPANDSNSGLVRDLNIKNNLVLKSLNEAKAIVANYRKNIPQFANLTDAEILERDRISKASQERQQQATIKQSKPQSTASKVWDIAKHPVTAFAYKAKGQNIPDNFAAGQTNPYDMVAGFPAQIVQSGLNLFTDNVMHPIDTNQALMKGAVNLFSNSVDGKNVFNDGSNQKALSFVGDLGNVLTLGELGAAAPIVDEIGGITYLEEEAAKQAAKAAKKSKIIPVQNAAQNTSQLKVTSEQVKDAYGYLHRRQFLKKLQEEGLVGTDFNDGDLNYTARSTDKTNALTKLALERRHTGFRNVRGELPTNGIGKQSYTGYSYDMNQPAFGQTISEMENMKKAGVDFNDPKSIAEYQATHIPLQDYGYRSTGEHPTPDYGFLFRNPQPTASKQYGNFQFKSQPNLDFTSGNYEDWFKKYHTDLEYHLKPIDRFNADARNSKTDDLSKTVMWAKDKTPSVKNSTLVGPRGSKAFEIDKTFPFQNMKNITPEQDEELKKYIQDYLTKYSTGWRGEYKKGGIITDPMGQWAHPGQNTRIPGGNITMQGVPYPVLAKASNGQQQMMYPGQDYSFPGASHVDEYPMMQQGGGWLDKYNLPRAEDGLQAGAANPRDYKGYSVVNYLAENGYPIDKKFRKNLAEEHNIEDYDYSADKNLELLHSLINDENFKSRVAEEQSSSNETRSVPVKKQGLNKGVLNLMMADIAPRSSNPKKVNTNNLFGSVTGTTPKPVVAPVRNTGFKQAPPVVAQPKIQIPAFNPYPFLNQNTLQPIVNQAGPIVKQTQAQPFNQISWNKNPMNPQNYVKGTKPVVKQAQQNIEEGDPIKKKQQPLSNDIGMSDLLQMFTLPGMASLGSKIGNKIANNELIQDATSVFKEKGISGLIDAYKNKQIRDKGLATGDDSSTVTNFVVPTVPANAKDSLPPPIVFGKEVVDTDRGDSGFYHAPMHIDLNRTKFGFKNRAGKPSTEQNGVTETAGLVLTPFASEYASGYKKRNSQSDDYLGTNTIRRYKDDEIKNEGVYGGIDDEGNFQLGYGKDMKGKNLNMADFRTIDTEGFVKDAQGNYKLGTETSNNRVSKVPHVKTDNGEDHLPFLVPNSGKNQDKTYGQNTGGKIIIATPDFKEKILVGGSLSDVDKALENFKAKYKLSKVKLIVLDNGTYSRGFMKKGNKISSKDWRKYEINSSGGAGFYLKGKGFKEGGSISDEQDNNWLNKYQFAGAVGSTLSAVGPTLAGVGSKIWNWANHEPTLSDVGQNLVDPIGLSNVPFVNQSIRRMVAQPSWGQAMGLGMDLAGMIPVYGEGARAARTTSMANKEANLATKAGRMVGKGFKGIQKTVEAPANLVKQGYKAVGVNAPAFNNSFNMWNKGVHGWELGKEGAQQGLNKVGQMFGYANGGQNKNWLNKYK